MKKIGKKGVMDQLGGLAIGIATLLIALVVTFLVVANTQAQIATVQGFNASNASLRTTAYNATITLNEAAATIPGWVPLIVIVVIGAAIIGLVSVFRGRR
jgi:hypothetical protein